MFQPFCTLRPTVMLTIEAYILTLNRSPHILTLILTLARILYTHTPTTLVYRGVSRRVCLVEKELALMSKEIFVILRTSIEYE
jgi:hypothetical protein